VPVSKALTEMNNNEVLQAFGITEALPDSVIESNSQPLFDLDDAIELVIPSYMAWCLKHDHSDGNIVIDGTISALSEIGRVKQNGNSYYKFKSECTSTQRKMIISFLEWCLSIDFLTHENTERAIKQWRKLS